jgi:hypothetical protein
MVAGQLAELDPRQGRVFSRTGAEPGVLAKRLAGEGTRRSRCDGDDQTLAKVAENSAESEIPKANTQNVLAKQQAG